MSDKRIAKLKANKEGGSAKGAKSGNKEANMEKFGNKRRGLGFQEVSRNDSKIVRKTIQKKHLVTKNDKSKKKNVRKSKGINDDDDDEPLDAPEDIHDDEPSKYDMFKKKSEKK